MKNNKLKKWSLANLILGYVMICMFVLLVLLNRATEPEVVAIAEIEDPDSLFSPIPDEPVLAVETTPTGDRFLGHPIVIDRDVGIDRLSGVIIDDPNPHVAVVHGNDRIVTPNLHETYIETNRGRDVHIGTNDTVHGVHNIRDRDHTGTTKHGTNYKGSHNINERVHHGVDDVDIGLLDRRLADLELGGDDSIGTIDLDAYNKAIKRDKKIGIDDDDINVGQLTLAREGDDVELGDLADLEAENGAGAGGYGVGKGGQLYAYNYPSQGVGAGIGSGGIGAGAGGSAGLGAGIGQGILKGETVPTLGGIGTYSSVEVVTPGTGTDTDRDGLTAEAEALLGTDPQKADSDGDGFVDGAEITSYTDPRNAASNPSVPGSESSPILGGVGGLVGGAGAGGAAGLVTGMVKERIGIGVGPGKGCAEHGGGCAGHHGHGKHTDYDHLPKDGALHIMMHVDGSGSILDTRKQLTIMKDTLLKDALLPYYNNSEELYNRRVTIVDGNGERTLQFFTEAAGKDNVLAVVFQDEAQPSYHLPTFNKKPQDHYSRDLGKLKASLNGYGGIYRGVMFQVDRGKTFAKSFKEFVESAWRGEGYLESSNLKKYYRDNNIHHIKNKDGIIFSDEYHAKDSGDPQYYLDLIFDASKKIGLDLNIYGAGLTDGRYNNKTN